MARHPRNELRRNLTLLVVFILVSVFLLRLSTGYEKRSEKQSNRCVGRVIEVDNTEIQQFGMVKTGDQKVRIKLESGPFEGRVVEGNNPLLGVMQRDKVFSEGDCLFRRPCFMPDSDIWI